MNATRLPEETELDIAQQLVTKLRPDQIENALEHLAGPGAVAEFGPRYVLFVRGLLLRRLESFRRGRRGLVSVLPIDPPS